MVMCSICEKMTCDPCSGLCPECFWDMMNVSNLEVPLPEALWPYRGKRATFSLSEWISYKHNARRFEDGKIDEAEFLRKRDEITNRIVESEKKKLERQKKEQEEAQTRRKCSPSMIFGP